MPYDMFGADPLEKLVCDQIICGEELNLHTLRVVGFQAEPRSNNFPWVGL